MKLPVHIASLVVLALLAGSPVNAADAASQPAPAKPDDVELAAPTAPAVVNALADTAVTPTDAASASDGTVAPEPAQAVGPKPVRLYWFFSGR